MVRMVRMVKMVRMVRIYRMCAVGHLEAFKKGEEASDYGCDKGS